MTHPDPHLWLEDTAASDVQDWIDRQNRRTLGQLESDPRYRPLRDAILGTLRDTRQIPYFSEHAGLLYNFHQDGSHPRGIYRRTTLDDYRAGTQQWETVLDVDALALAEGLDWYLDGVSHLTVAPERTLVSLTPDGGDAAITREFDVATGRFVEDGFVFGLGKNHVAWRDRDSVYVCPAWEGAALTRAGYPREVWLLGRGQDWSEARLLYRAPREAMMVAAWRFLSADGAAFDLIEVSDSFYVRQYFRIGDDLALTPLDLPGRCEVEAWLHGHLVIKLGEAWRGHAAGSLLAVGPAGEVTLLVTPGERMSVEMVEATRHYLLVTLLDNVRSRLVGFALQEGQWRQFDTPAQQGGVIEFVDQPWLSDTLYYAFGDFLTPTGLYRLALPEGRPERLRSQPDTFDPAPYVAEQWHATAPDGVRIPCFVVRRRDAPMDGSTPTLLYGYGGFEVSMLPHYVDNFGEHWLDKGGAFVVANIRGGGEFGPDWHQAAQGIRRPVSFDDFIAVAEYLIERGLTAPARLAIEGGSNGGLLVAAAMVRRPDLFGAVVCEVPLTDMLRYDALLAGASWMDEYGDPADPAVRSVLADYSPYHQVKPGVPYPPMLLTTSASDDRVHPGHARKLAARMQAQGHAPLFFENGSGGHGGVGDQVLTASDLARVLVFLYQTLMDAAPFTAPPVPQDGH